VKYLTNGEAFSSKVREVCYNCHSEHITNKCGIQTSINEVNSGDESDVVVKDEDAQGSDEVQVQEVENQSSPISIKMLVLNLGNYNEWDDENNNSWLLRLIRIGNFISENSVDLLFFSEVMFDYNKTLTQKTMEDMAGNIVDYLQSIKIFCKIHTDPAMFFYREGQKVLFTEDYNNFWEGLASITCNERLYMLTSEVMFLEETQDTTDQYNRIAQYTRFQYHEKVFGCVNSHWSTDAKERLSNVHETLERLNEWKDISKVPNVIVGDLSAVSSDESLTILAKAGWKDVYREKYPNDQGNTVYHSVWQRQDYIWANDLFYPGIGNIELVGKPEQASKDDYWSDHFGLLLTFNVDDFSELTDIPTGMPVTAYPTYTLRPTPNPVVVPNSTQEENKLTVEDVERHFAFDIIVLLLILFLCCMLFPVYRWLWSTSSINSTVRKTKRYNQLEDPEIDQPTGSASIGE